MGREVGDALDVLSYSENAPVERRNMVGEGQVKLRGHTHLGSCKCHFLLAVKHVGKTDSPHGSESLMTDSACTGFPLLFSVA